MSKSELNGYNKVGHDSSHRFWFVRAGRGYATGSVFVALVEPLNSQWRYKLTLFIGTSRFLIGQMECEVSRGEASSESEALLAILGHTRTEETTAPF